MAEPDLVARCVSAMADAVSVPVTVKCRIGIDDQDTEADFRRFIETVAAAGCRIFIVHARKAWLKGLSPKENRELPPLDYARVYRLKAERPDLTIVLNGGIATLDACEEHLRHVDGVMLGRAAYHEPYLLADVDRRLFGASDPPVTRRAALERLIPAIERQIGQGGRLNNLTRHVLGLYHGRPRGRLFRRILSEEGQRPGADVRVLLKAIAAAEGEPDLALSAAAE
jgi:tRNA-dihydrouridine synthase A